MNLTPPKQIVFLASVVLAVLGLLGVLGILIPSTLGAWLLVAAYGLLAAGVVLNNF